jgi:Flp pilus assembly protein TadG
MAKGGPFPREGPAPQNTNREIALMKIRFQMKSERGQTMTEFALILPLLALFLFAVIQFGIVFNNYLTVTDAARAGARAGITAPYGSKDCVGAAEAAARNSADNLDDGSLGVAVALPSGCDKGGDITVTVTYPYQISLIGIVVSSGDLESSTTERIE